MTSLWCNKKRLACYSMCACAAVSLLAIIFQVEWWAVYRHHTQHKTVSKIILGCFSTWYKSRRLFSPIFQLIFFFSFLRAPHHVRPYWHCQCHAQCHRKSSWILGMCPSRLFYRSYNEIIAVQPTSPTTHGEHNYLRYFLQKGSNVINLSLLLQHIWTCTVTGDGRQCRQVVQDGYTEKIVWLDLLEVNHQNLINDSCPLGNYGIEF